MVRLAHGRRRLRRGRLPRHRPGLRHPGRGRGAHWRRARPRPQDHHRHRANHCSDQHRWFTAAMAAGPGTPEREQVLVPARPRAVRRAAAQRLAVDVRRTAWTRVTEADGRPGEWYLHLYAPEQPDLNWENPEVRAEFEDILRFWLDRGVDGFRIDVADFLVKDPALPDVAGLADGARRPWEDQDGLHDVLPLLAAAYRLLPGRPGVRRRALAQAADQAAALPRRRSAAHRVQLRLPRRAVGRRQRCGPSSMTDAHQHRRGRAVGAVQPRRDQAPDQIRPGRHGHRLAARSRPA